MINDYPQKMDDNRWCMMMINKDQHWMMIMMENNQRLSTIVYQDPRWSTMIDNDQQSKRVQWLQRIH